MQPGDHIASGGSAPSPDQPAPLNTDVPPQPVSSQPDSTPQTGWAYTGAEHADSAGSTPPSQPTANPISWTAAEYIAHHKGTSWFILVGLSVVVLAAALYFITKELISPIVVGLVGLSFAIFAVRQPKLLEYSVDGIGLHIGTKFYPYYIFRSFSVLQEESVRSILLMPLQRFGLPITLYYDQKDEEKIITVLGMHLPHEVRQVAPIDRLMSKIRF